MQNVPAHPQKAPLVLMILDGWGYRDASSHNAIAKANTPQWDTWWKTRPHILLEASGKAVGLPERQMGNSEVGHMHIGAGRIITQDYTRINHAIACGEFATNPVLLTMIDDMQRDQKAIHVMGLLSNGGVHSHEKHLFAFLSLCHEKQFTNVHLHLFLDGRDTPPQSAQASLHRLEHHLKKNPCATISSITGRYFAMDRDNRWSRIEPLYHLIVDGKSPHHFSDAKTAIDAFYKQNIYDEFIPPTTIGTPAPLKDGDSIFFFNYRSDRARQLTEAFFLDSFDHFPRLITRRLAHIVTMTQYADYLNTEVAFPQRALSNTLGEVIAASGLQQLRIAETEKYAHVTFFFNGGIEPPFLNEDRILIPSPSVATYNLQPEMSGPALTNALIDAILSLRYDVIICNYANADMVGHTGDFLATVKAIEFLDEAMHQTANALSKVGGQLLITSDHGNADCMFDDTTQQTHTAHTSHPVPLLYVGYPGWHFNQNTGSLCDIAPTILSLLNIPIPTQMTGNALLVKNND